MKRIFILAFIFCTFFFGKAYCYPDIVKSTQSVSSGAQKIVLSPNYRYLFTFSSSSSVMVVFDTFLNKEVSTYSIGSTPNDAFISDDGLNIYLVSSLSDSVTVLDVSDPENVEEQEVLDVGTSSVTFSDMSSAEISGSLYLYLTDRSNNRVYVYNSSTEELVDSSDNPINLSFSPQDIDVSPDESTLSVLGSDGEFHVFNTSTFVAVRSLLDIGAYTTSASFKKVMHANVPNFGEVAFVLNSNSTGEIFLVNMTNKLSGTLSMIDADPSGGDPEDPIVVGSGPLDIFYTTVANPDSGETSAGYVYCSLGDNSLSIVDTKLIADADTVTPFTSIAGVGDVKKDGIKAGSSSDGHLYALASDGPSIKVITENPLVTLVSPGDEVSIESGSVDVTFKSDLSGTYKFVNYSGSAQESVLSTVGTLLQSGSMSSDEEITYSVSVNELSEGENIIAFFATSGNYTGRGAIKIIYDIPPPAISGLKVEFGNEKIIVSFHRLTETDIDYYNIYFGTSSGSLTGADGIASPVEVTQPTSGSWVQYTIEPLTNDIEIFVQVSAVDNSGTEGEKSDILSATPEVTIGPLGLSGETGCGMSASGNAEFALIVLLLLLLLLLSRTKVVNVLLVVFILSVTGGVYAQDDKPIRLNDPLPKEEKEAPKETGLLSEIKDEPVIKLKDRMSMSLRITWFMPSSSLLDQFYTAKGNEMYTLKNTYFLWFMEIGLEAGFLLEEARLIGETSGLPSGEKSQLMMAPFTIPLIFNLRFQQDQMLVPYLKTGYTLLWFRMSEPGTTTVNGLASMILAGGGLKLNFEEFRTSNDRDIGINHMYLFTEWLYTHHFKRAGGISFTGHYWGFGLGIDY